MLREKVFDARQALFPIPFVKHVETQDEYVTPKEALVNNAAGIREVQAVFEADVSMQASETQQIINDLAIARAMFVESSDEENDTEDGENDTEDETKVSILRLPSQSRCPHAVIL